MQIVDKSKEDKIPAILRLGFRPLFLGASTFSVLAMVIWALFWSGQSQFSSLMYSNPIWWHSHEMLFGFSGAIIIGFLLTAVQNWTGQTGIKGTKLLVLFALWLCARLGLMFGSVSSIWLFVDTAWIFLAMYYLAVPIIKVKQYRNLFFVPVLSLFGMMNVKFHLVALGALYSSIITLTLPIVVVVTLITLVVGGRVIPFFTWRGTQTEQITRIKVIEFAALIPVWLLLLATLMPSSLISAKWVGVLAIITAMTNLIRFSRWRSFSTLTNPLLWTLHLSYLSLIVGLFVLGLSEFSPVVNASIAIHILVIGGIGGMILSMISRVSLGHTGRTLKVNMIMQVAFVALFSSLLVRVVLVYAVPSFTMDSYVLSASLWALAFAIFAIVYFPILTKPRVDGHPG